MSSASSGGTGAPVIGLDLGGTKIAAVFFGADGAVPARLNRLTGPEAEWDHLAVPLEMERGASARTDVGRGTPCPTPPVPDAPPPRRPSGREVRQRLHHAHRLRGP
ncbi:hypothetical protein [Streptomyces sp. NPDC014727]|uniref:hypothetical protein n=1 Tax=Streptomyces sp. NPDC014727 TaxID=3364883 RepID=UPI0036F51DA6